VNPASPDQGPLPGLRLPLGPRRLGPGAALAVFVHAAVVGALVIGSMMAASAGALTGPVNMIAPDMGRTEMLNAFAAIILGGFGNVNGTILGALLIGMIQSFGAVYVSNAYSTSIAFGLLVLTLIFFPRGLVPERVDENV